MNARSLVALVVFCLGGCAASKEQVLFVTSTSFGVQFAKTPPTASIAYDRAEGYFGPSYSNGALPPVAAVFGSGGTIFQPQVRQLYTTGAAALLATKADEAALGPGQLLSSSDNDKHIMFFGTGTTIGLKVGFDPSGTPDTLSFGYRRLELSLIHLGHQTEDGVEVDVYPSVLASIDTTSSATSPADTGIHIQQFFATGQAADALATSDEVQAIIKGMATGSLTATLTDQQKADAAAGAADAKTIGDNLTAIKGCVAPNGAFDAAKWKKLVGIARTKDPTIPIQLESYPDWSTVSDNLNGLPKTAKDLFEALPSPPSSC
jgi:hypothetical protein